MHIEHVAIWTQDIERLRVFYETYFGARADLHYTDASNEFQSISLSFAGGARLEVMQMPGVDLRGPGGLGNLGYAHFAVSVGSEEGVDTLTRRLGQDGYRVTDGPHTTGDGYYESGVLDPDGNRVEITV